MKKLLLASVLLVTPALAQEQVNTDFVKPLGYCQLTATGSAAQMSTCSGGIPARSIWAVICVETANIRWRDDGTNPTTTVGMPITAGNCLDYSGTFNTFAFIAVSGSPVLNISFYNQAPRS